MARTRLAGHQNLLRNAVMTVLTFSGIQILCVGEEGQFHIWWASRSKRPAEHLDIGRLDTENSHHSVRRFAGWMLKGELAEDQGESCL